MPRVATAETNSALSHQKTVLQQVLQYIRRKNANMRTPHIQALHLNGPDVIPVSDSSPADDLGGVFTEAVGFPEAEIPVLAVLYLMRFRFLDFSAVLLISP